MNGMATALDNPGDTTHIEEGEGVVVFPLTMLVGPGAGQSGGLEWPPFHTPVDLTFPQNHSPLKTVQKCIFLQFSARKVTCPDP